LAQTTFLLVSAKSQGLVHRRGWCLGEQLLSCLVVSDPDREQGGHPGLVVHASQVSVLGSHAEGNVEVLEDLSLLLLLVDESQVIQRDVPPLFEVNLHRGQDLLQRLGSVLRDLHRVDHLVKELWATEAPESCYLLLPRLVKQLNHRGVVSPGLPPLYKLLKVHVLAESGSALAVGRAVWPCAAAWGATFPPPPPTCGCCGGCCGLAGAWPGDDQIVPAPPCDGLPLAPLAVLAPPHVGDAHPSCLEVGQLLGHRGVASPLAAASSKK
jgi:hypothetical protein